MRRQNQLFQDNAKGPDTARWRRTSIKTASRIAHDLARAAHVAELLGQFQQSDLGANDLLLSGYRRLLARVFATPGRADNQDNTTTVRFHRAFYNTLIVTAKLNDVDPQVWLADVLARIAEPPHTRVHELLPWNWKAARHQTLAAQAGSHLTIRLQTRRHRGIGPHVPRSSPNGYFFLVRLYFA